MLKIVHGQSRRSTSTATPEYVVWINMMSNHRDGVCDRWKSFDNFYADMGVRPSKSRLSRTDKSNSYGPGNCKWMPVGRDIPDMLKKKGITKSIKELAVERGLREGTLYTRLMHYGWTLERALTTPARQWTS